MQMKDDEILWSERYRPQKVSECVLPNRLKKVFQEYVNSKTIPNLMLTGSAGVGKTTAAVAMCRESGTDYIIINSSEERGIDTLRNKVTNYASTISFNGGHKVIIMDEADGLTPEAQYALRGAMEKFSANCTFILTCNFKSRLMDAIHSRCAVVDFTLKSNEKPAMANMFYKRLLDILDQEKVQYDKAVLTSLVTHYFPDYRRTLNELQRFSKENGNINADIMNQVSDIRNMPQLTKSLKEKNWGEMRKWVVSNSDMDSNRIYRKIYDNLFEVFQPSSIPQAVIILGKYQYQNAFVADQEINLVACLTEMMVDCEFL